MYVPIPEAYGLVVQLGKFNSAIDLKISGRNKTDLSDKSKKPVLLCFLI